MNKIYILCVDDEPAILDAVERDIAEFEDHFPIETAESAQETRQLIQSILEAGDQIGLILCDHIMPGETGAQLLIAMENDLGLMSTRKVLLTGQAGLEATVDVINNAKLSYYIAKPWTSEGLKTVVRNQLTDYILTTGQNPMPYIQSLDTVRVLETIHQKGLHYNE